MTRSAWLRRAPVLVAVIAAALLLALAYAVPVRWDATADDRHTVVPALLDALDSAAGDEPVQAYVVFSAALPASYAGLRRHALDLLDDIARRRPVDVLVLDPDGSTEDAARIEELGVVEGALPGASQDATVTRTAASIVLQSGDRTLARVDRLVPGQPLQIALAYDLIERQRERPPRIGVLMGHGTVFDRLAAEGGESVLTSVLRALEAQVFAGRYRLEPIVRGALLDTELDGLLVLGPTMPFDDEARDALASFVSRGGAVALLLDPYRPFDPTTVELERNELGLAGLLSEWGVERREGVVFDEEGAALSVRFSAMPGEAGVPVEVPAVAPDARVPLMTGLVSENALVADLPFLAFSPVDRRRPAPIGALSVQAPARALVLTGPSARLETRDDGVVATGPLPVVAETRAGEGRVLVASSSAMIAQLLVQDDPLRDSGLLAGSPAARQLVAEYSASQMGFFENLADWLAASPELAALRAHVAPRTVRARQLSSRERAVFLTQAIAAQPLLVLVTGLGFGVLVRRRRRSLVSPTS